MDERATPDLADHKPPGRLVATADLDGVTLLLPYAPVGLRVLFWGVYTLFTGMALLSSMPPRLFFIIASVVAVGLLIERLLLWGRRHISHLQSGAWRLLALGCLGLSIVGLYYPMLLCAAFALGAVLISASAGRATQVQLTQHVLRLKRAGVDAILPLEELEGVQVFNGRLVVVHRGRALELQHDLRVEESTWVQTQIERAIADRRRALQAEGHDISQPSTVPQALHQLQNPAP